MTAADYEAAQRARDAHAALVEGRGRTTTPTPPRRPSSASQRPPAALKLSPEAVQRILDAFDNIIEAINRMIEWAAQAIRTLADFFGETLDNFILRRAPPKWRHYAPPCEAGPRPQGNTATASGGPSSLRWLRKEVGAREVQVRRLRALLECEHIPADPRGGYICPHCESRLRAGETLPNQRPGQNDRPQTTKGAKP